MKLYIFSLFGKGPPPMSYPFPKPPSLSPRITPLVAHRFKDNRKDTDDLPVEGIGVGTGTRTSVSVPGLSRQAT